MKGVGGCVNLHVLHRPSLQRVIFGGQEGEVLSVLTLARTRESRRLLGRRSGRQEEVDL